MILRLNETGLTYAGDTLERGPQSWTRKTSVQWGGHKIRSTITRDSYAAQSHLFVEVWSPAELKWNRVHALSGSEHADALPSAYSKDDSKIYAATQDLVDRLIAYAQWAVGEA